jgi:aminoglycoside phosphotransferase (APT) family kinase protein
MSQTRDAFQDVLNALTADPSTEFGLPGAQVTVLRQVDGPFSSVQHVRIQTPARTIHAYTKILKPRRPGADELAMIDRMLRREYAATRALYDALHQDAEVRAVRPIAFLPEHRAMATEEVPGRPLGELLADSSQATDRLLTIASRVGRWVREYQRLGGVSGHVELAERRGYFDDRLKLIEGRVLSSAERAATLARFDALAREIGRSSVPAMQIHADLTPMNIIVDDEGRVAVLDFTMAKTGTVYHDLSHVFFHLELIAARHRSRRVMCHALQRALLAGYDPALAVADPLFRLMLMQHSVCHVAMLAERRVPVVDAAYRWFLKRRWQLCERIPEQEMTRRVA